MNKELKCHDCNKEFTTLKGLANHRRNGCSTLKPKKLSYCKECVKEITYGSTYCQSHAQLNRAPHTKETKEKISSYFKEAYKNGSWIPNMKGTQSEESRKKMGETKRGKKLTEEHKKKISSGINNSEIFKIAQNDPELRKKRSEFMKGKIFSNEHKENLSKNHANISGDNNPSKKPEVRQKLRSKAIERLNLRFGDSGWVPGFNKLACEFLDIIAKETNTKIQHALNGGEFYIKELGYWVDGYDIQNNIVYEIYEFWHFNKNGIQCNRDIRRKQEIQEKLKCKFIEIKWPKNNDYSKFNLKEILLPLASE